VNLLSRLARLARPARLALVLAAAPPLSGCVGPWAATRRLWHWNSHWEEEWGREGLFLVTFPLYVVYATGDFLLFNTVAFWSGDGWIDAPGGDHSFQATLPGSRERVVVERAGDGWTATLLDGDVAIASWPLASIPIASASAAE